MNPEMQPYLQSSATVDSDHPEIIGYVKKQINDSDDMRTQAINLYYAVRDDIRYDPYSLDLSVAGLLASHTLEIGRGWCVAKAILLAACCRAAGIPARLGFADIRNHLSTERLRQQMKTDIFYWHGYTSIYLDGMWVKATPAFNIELCDKFRIRPLDFDGRNDSIYHPFDLEGNKHMEYLKYRGEFADVPMEEMMKTFTQKYLAGQSSTENPLKNKDFDRDVEKETA